MLKKEIHSTLLYLENAQNVIKNLCIRKKSVYFSDTLKMHDRCNHCDTKYKIEPSFFYGSMYVSYAVGVAFAIAAFIISNLFLGTSLMVAFFCIVGTLVGFMPVIIRLSRNIWINLFMN